MVNGVRFLISEDLALGLISQELLCGRVLLKCEKGTEKASDTDIRRGRSVSPSLVFQFSSVPSLSRVRLLATPWTTPTPGLPVHHQLPELTQTHVHGVGDAIQPSNPLSSPSPPTFNLSQHQDLFQ